MNFELFAPKPPKPQKQFRKCDPKLVEAAWSCFWDAQFVAKIDSYRKMQWGSFREAVERISTLRPYSKKIAAAYLYMFACWSNANPGVPLFPLVRGAPPGDPLLLAEIRNAPRLVRKSCKFLWKDRPTVPESLSEFGGFGAVVWKEELATAESRTIQRIREFRNESRN